MGVDFEGQFREREKARRAKLSPEELLDELVEDRLAARERQKRARFQAKVDNITGGIGLLLLAGMAAFTVWAVYVLAFT